MAYYLYKQQERNKMICFDCEELIEYGDLNFVDEGEYSQVAVDTKCWWNRLRKEGF